LVAGASVTGNTEARLQNLDEHVLAGWERGHGDFFYGRRPGRDVHSIYVRTREYLIGGADGRSGRPFAW
jgi:hypothetical protein